MLRTGSGGDGMQASGSRRHGRGCPVHDARSRWRLTRERRRSMTCPRAMRGAAGSTSVTLDGNRTSSELRATASSTYEAAYGGQRVPARLFRYRWRRSVLSPLCNTCTSLRVRPPWSCEQHMSVPVARSPSLSPAKQSQRGAEARGRARRRVLFNARIGIRW